mmetsp:Transcript_36935/g.72672  ORF Transcript_36935/g.72672 Transcript_36935/m.72672 type:complete len:82 (-) Transcript_36935:321-566(-)
MRSVTFVVKEDALMKKAIIWIEKEKRQTRVQEYHEANVRKETSKSAESKNFAGRNVPFVGKSELLRERTGRSELLRTEMKK